MAWLRRAAYPLVFKLRAGAGAYNVHKVEDFEAARALCWVAFGKGFRSVPRYFSDTARKVRAVSGWGTFWGRLKRLPRRMTHLRHAAGQMPQEKGYALFQDFMSDNHYDTRVVVVGDRAWGYRRYTRPGDFRASGSKVRDCDPANVELECVRIAFDVALKLRLQSVAFDFVKGPDGRPLVVELSYGFGGFHRGAEVVQSVRGCWSRDLTWRETDMWPQDAMVMDLLCEIDRRKEVGRSRRDPEWVLA